jgi:hypothetical protein
MAHSTRSRPARIFYDETLVAERTLCHSVRGFCLADSPADALYSFFISRHDITLQRLQAATHVCGHVPRTCFGAIGSLHQIRSSEAKLRNAIIDDFKGVKAGGDKVSYSVYEVKPVSPSRLFELSTIQPVSEFAKLTIRAQVLMRCSAKERYDYYMKMQSSSSLYAGNIFEDAVHAYFKSITKPTVFSLRSLNNKESIQITFSPDISFETFSTMRMFSALLTTAVEQERSCYLQPDVPNHESFDAYLYLHDVGTSGCLFFIQVSRSGRNSIAISGCKKVQLALTIRSSIAKFRSTKNHPWPIVFAESQDIAASFRHPQTFRPPRTSEEDKENEIKTWVPKTTQYVLEIPVMNSMGVTDS